MTALATVEMPPRVACLPRDRRGYPVPWFVAIVDGAPDFRVVGPGRVGDAYTGRRCWICGERLGRNTAYVIGPMCAINRVSSEPPSHRECAIYAARVCPFLTKPHMRRRENSLPDGIVDPAGTPIRRNPGVALVWVTRARPLPFQAHDGGILFDVGEPIETLWFSEGRPATRAEVDASVDSGFPLLAAEAEKEGPAAVLELARLVERAQAHLPADAA